MLMLNPGAPINNIRGIINSSPKYLTLWALSRKNPELIKICETMARLVCHASLLWADDIRLKHLPEYTKSCPPCDLAAPDDVRHLILQCPSSEVTHMAMFSNLDTCA